MLAVVLLAAACCGGDDAAEKSENLPAGAAAVSEVTTEDVDRSGTAESDPAGQPDQADSAAGSEQAAEPEPQPQPAPALVRLGDRFPWCADIQDIWDYRAETLAQLEAAETTLQQAQSAFDAAADELDRAEAQQVLEAAEAAHTEAALRVQGANRSVAWLLHPDRDLSDDTEVIAVQRADAAWRASADPAIAELHDFIRDPGPAEPWPEEPQQVEPQVGWTKEEVLTALERVQDTIDEAAQAIVSLLWDLDASITAIRDADSPGAVIAALQRSIDATHALERARPHYHAAVETWTLQTSAEVWDDEQVLAVFHGIKGPDVGEEVPAWVLEGGEGLNASGFAEYAISVGRNRAEDTAKSAAAAFMVADTAGMAAIQASFSESCEAT